MSTHELVQLAAAALEVADEPERVLEIECGVGDGALFLAREFPRARIRGVDASEENVRLARSRVGLDPEGRLAFKPGAPGALPFPDDHFDLVAQREGRVVAREVARVLRPGGSFLLHADEVPREPLGLRRRMTLRRLARHGLAAAREREGDGGRFLVARVPAGGGTAGAD